MSNFSDTLLTEAPGNDRPVVASDVEGTVSSGYAWHGMRDFLINNGYHKRYKRFFRKNFFRVLGYQFNLVDKDQFKLDWMVGMLSLFHGFTPDEMLAAGRYLTEKEIWPNRREAVVTELSQYVEQGHRVVLVSGMFEPFLQAVMEKIPGVEGIGTQLVYDDDGKFTGEMVGTFNRGDSKANSLQPFLQDGKVSAAFGDTGADIQMLSLANRPVAVAPDTALREVAESQGWTILEG